jgi:glycosyltransferase involved in cell wall biosynthesis
MTIHFPISDIHKSSWPWVEHGSELFDKSLKWPKISIVTPSFNQGKYIEETIRSVLMQNYPNLEYIIIDGGSTDETIEIIKKYEPWITYWVSEEDRGQSEAINKGIEKCTGEIFNWLNSDDWYEPDALFIVAKAFMENKGIQFVSGYENHIVENGTTNIHNGTYIKGSLEETIACCEVTQPSTFFKLDSIKRVGGVSNDLHYIMDGEMWVKLLLFYGQDGFKKLNKTLVNFRLHENSKTISNSIINNFLVERSSIINNLQSHLRLPQFISEYYLSDFYKTKAIINLNTSWQVNRSVISKRKLKIYFVKQYIISKFSNNKKSEVFKGIKLLVRYYCLDLFLFRNFIKLLFK